MKINDYLTGTKTHAYGGEAKTGQVDRKEDQPRAETTEQAVGDKVQLSGKSREIGRAQEIVQSGPDVRADKVAEIKARYDAGEYQVDAGKVADAMIRGGLDEIV